MIRFVLATDAASRAVRKEYEDRVEGPIDRAEEKIARARFAIYGASTYPDATFSLRLSYGKVTGWTENGTQVAPFTYYSGLWKRATGEFPFALPPRWEKAKGKLNDNTVFDFVTTNDIIGGNSGSPVVNTKGEYVGLIFDGNIESLPGRFLYSETANRAVAVHSAAIIEVLRKLYDAGDLADELERNAK